LLLHAPTAHVTGELRWAGDSPYRSRPTVRTVFRYCFKARFFQPLVP